MSQQHQEFVDALLRGDRRETRRLSQELLWPSIRRLSPASQEALIQAFENRTRQQTIDILRDMDLDKLRSHSRRSRRRASLSPHLDPVNFVTMDTIPYHRAVYIPENVHDDRIMHVYNKRSIENWVRSRGRKVSPMTRRNFTEAVHIPRRLRTEYIRRSKE